jgi:hypothetical protein
MDPSLLTREDSVQYNVGISFEFLLACSNPAGAASGGEASFCLPGKSAVGEYAGIRLECTDR